MIVCPLEPVLEAFTSPLLLWFMKMKFSNLNSFSPATIYCYTLHILCIFPFKNQFCILLVQNISTISMSKMSLTDLISPNHFLTDKEPGKKVEFWASSSIKHRHFWLTVFLLFFICLSYNAKKNPCAGFFWKWILDGFSKSESQSHYAPETFKMWS